MAWNNLSAMIIPKPMSKGAIPMVVKRPKRDAKSLPEATASCLVMSIISNNAPAPMLKTDVNPMAAMVVIVVTMLTDTVVITT